MKTRTFYRSMVFTGMVTVTMAAVAFAQQPRSHNNSAMWFGGNLPSQKNQPSPAISNGNAEILNQADRDDDNQVRYRVVRIGVLPGKTTSFLSIVRSVNNREHVTGYSLIDAEGFTPKGAATAQGFIWHDGKLEALPLLSGWPGAFGFGINDRDQVAGTANNVDASGNLIQTAVLWNHEQPVNLGSLHAGWISEGLDVNIFGEVVVCLLLMKTNFPRRSPGTAVRFIRFPCFRGKMAGGQMRSTPWRDCWVAIHSQANFLACGIGMGPGTLRWISELWAERRGRHLALTISTR